MDTIINKTINNFILREFHTQELSLSEVLSQLDVLMRTEKKFNVIEMFLYKHFGSLIGCGSSRIVFEIDDTMVLKVAFNKYGFYQN